MSEKALAAVWASFAADALALGVHWIYDVEKIKSDWGTVDHFLPPGKDGYHRGKAAGDFTHYGDQTLALLTSLAARGDFDLGHFASSWRDLFENYGGYLDHATKETLSGFAQGKPPAEAGSTSTDLGGAVRIAPLAYLYREKRDRLIEAAREQTAMTHNTPLAVECAGFLAETTWRVLAGATPRTALADTAENRPAVKRLVEKGLASIGMDTRRTIGKFGQMCDATAALPGVVHLVGTFDTDLKRALVENVMAGGDSAARGMAVGMILGAHLGLEAVPADWRNGINAGSRIGELLGKLP